MKKFNLFVVLIIFLLVSLGIFSCDNGSTNPDAPVITQLVVGVMLNDYINGVPEKTTFKAGDHFYYGFRITDTNGDWDMMIHKIRYKETGEIFDASWSFDDDFAGSTNIGYSGGYNLGPNTGTYILT